MACETFSSQIGNLIRIDQHEDDDGEVGGKGDEESPCRGQFPATVPGYESWGPAGRRRQGFIQRFATFRAALGIRDHDGIMAAATDGIGQAHSGANDPPRPGETGKKENHEEERNQEGGGH